MWKYEEKISDKIRQTQIAKKGLDKLSFFVYAKVMICLMI